MSDASVLSGIPRAIEAAAGQNPVFAAADAADLAACVSVFSANEMRNEGLYEVYEGKVGLRSVPAYVPPRYQNLHIGCPWPEVAVQSVVERSRLDKFVFADEDADEAAGRLQEISDRCDLPAGYQAGLTDALIAGVSFVVVARDEVGATLRWHTAQGAAGIWDYAHGRLKCGFAIVDRERKGTSSTGDEWQDTVPSKVDFYTARGCWELTREAGAWRAEWLPDAMGEPRMLALTFRPDGRHPLGRSRFTEPMRGIVQEYMANALNLHVASEYTAIGQKWVTGLTDAQYDDLIGSKWKFSADNVVLLTDNPESGSAPALGNFTQQSMEPILSVKRSLATDFAAAASIPVSSLLTQDSNPTSAEAITAMENKLIALVESMNELNGRVLRRLALMLMAIDSDCGIDGLSDAQRSVMVHMRRPETASAAAQSDSAMKRVSAFPWMATSDVIIEDLGFTADQQERLKSERDRYEARQMVAQAAQSAGLDLSGAGAAGDGS